MTRMKELRIAKGVTQEELAKVLNVKKAAISKYENGRVDPSINVLKLAAKYFDVPVDYIIGNDPASTEDKRKRGTIMLELYRNIKRIREKQGMSQDELARLVGFKSRSSINKIELGINDITQSKLIAIAKALHVTPSELMGDDKEVETLIPDDNLLAEYAQLSEEGRAQLKDYLKFLLTKESAVKKAM